MLLNCLFSLSLLDKQANNSGVSYKLVDNVLYVSGSGDITRHDTLAYAEDTHHVIVNDSIASVGPDAFANFEKLQTVYIKVFYIGSIEANAFANCTALESFFVEASSLAVINQTVFLNCRNLKNLTINSESSFDLFTGMFDTLDNLETLNFGCSMIFFRNYVFKNRKNLKTVNLISNTIFTEKEIFAGCSNLTKFYLKTRCEVYISADMFKDCNLLETFTVKSTHVMFYENCFKDFTNLYKVIINANSVGFYDYAFYGCKFMNTLTVNAVVEKIGYKAFANMTRLMGLEMNCPDIVIEDEAFADDKFLWYFKAAGNILRIGNKAFYNCETLINFTSSSDVLFVDNYAFAGCVALRKFEVQGNIQKIMETAFTGDRKLYRFYVKGDFMNITNAFCSVSEFYIGGNVKIINNEAFYKCNFQQELVDFNIVGKVEKIGVKAFGGCTLLKDFHIGKISNLPDQLFLDCGRLESLEFVSDKLTVGQNVFMNSGVRDIKIVTSDSINFGSNFLYGTNNLKNFELQAKSVDFLSNAFDQSSVNKLFVRSVKITIRSKAITYSNISQLVLHSNSLILEDSAFAQTTSLKSIEVTAPEIAIPTRCFDGCSNLANINITNKLTNLGEHAFHNCVLLKSISITSDYDFTISPHCFCGCDLLESFSLKSSTVSFSGYCFHRCYNLVNLNIDSEVLSIGDFAFFNTSIYYLRLRGKISNIGNSAFMSSKTEFVLLESAIEMTIADNAFYESKRLISFVTQNDVIIGKRAFYECRKLLVFNANSVISMDENAFSYCEQLSSFKVNGFTQVIPAYAFYKCEKLSNLNFASNSTIFGNSSFSGTGVISMTFIANNINLYDGAFSKCKDLQTVAVFSENATFNNYVFGESEKLNTFYYCGYTTNVPLSVFYNCSLKLVYISPNYDKRSFAGLATKESDYCPASSSDAQNSFKVAAIGSITISIILIIAVVALLVLFCKKRKYPQSTTNPVVSTNPLISNPNQTL